MYKLRNTTYCYFTINLCFFSVLKLLRPTFHVTDMFYPVLGDLVHLRGLTGKKKHSSECPNPSDFPWISRKVKAVWQGIPSFSGAAWEVGLTRFLPNINDEK